MFELVFGMKLSVNAQSTKMCGMSFFGIWNAHPNMVALSLFFSVLIAFSALGACMSASDLLRRRILATVSLPCKPLNSSPSTRSEMMVCPLRV